MRSGVHWFRVFSDANSFLKVLELRWVTAMAVRSENIWKVEQRLPYVVTRPFASIIVLPTQHCTSSPPFPTAFSSSSPHAHSPRSKTHQHTLHPGDSMGAAR